MNETFNSWLLRKKENEFKNEVIRKEELINFITDVKALIFPGYVDNITVKTAYLDNKILDIKKSLNNLLHVALMNEACNYEEIIDSFFNQLPKVDELLTTDLDAIYEGDPAAKSKDEIILCYPGLDAIFTYRIAHILYDLNIPILPRALSEHAHSKTGIDIHPGAKIGPYFFIDHGTGIVIGETTEIGEHVKIYQGVTLGALSLRDGQKLKGSKRHPTIKDYVTIYSGASIFGGETVIGYNCTIGSSAYIISSVEDNTVVTIQGQKKKSK